LIENAPISAARRNEAISRPERKVKTISKPAFPLRTWSPVDESVGFAQIDWRTSES